MAFVDYYKTLGISKNATDKEIKTAYRKLARKFHPDINPDNKEAEISFKKINEANQVLSDPENRKKYDTYGENWKHGAEYQQAQSQQHRQHQSQNQSGQQEFSEEAYSDFFESMFGGASGSSRQRQSPRFKGQDFNAALHLNLKDVYTSHQQV